MTSKTEKQARDARKRAMARFLNEAFLVWERTKGQRQDVKTWAVQMQVDNASLNNWMKARRLPDPKSLEILALTLGPEVFEIAGVVPTYSSNPNFVALARRWLYIPQAKQRQMREQAEKYEVKKETNDKDRGERRT